MKRTLALFVLIVLFATAVVSEALFSKKNVSFSMKVRKGERASDVLRELSEKTNTNYLLLKLATKFLSFEPKFGCYTFRGNLSALDILSELKKGTPCSVRVTIPEGYNVYEIAETLQSVGVCPKETFIKISSKYEGFLFPDTYLLKKNDCIYAKTVMLSNFKKKVYPLFSDYKAPSIVKRALGKVSLKKIITVASLVEKETSNESEKPVIAGVIYRRLILGMPLDCDPTVIYGYLLKGIKIEHLKPSQIRELSSPYNTYKKRGLPPSPICNPGLSSIKAAMYPKRTKFLYYFAPPGYNHHIFSKSYSEHLLKLREFYAKKKKKIRR